jgi:hypothetical protein
MPRISQAQTQERSAFLLELIREQPDISRQEAQERFEEKFDATLNPKTFQQLREQVKAESTRPPAEEPSRDEHDSSDSDEDGAAQGKPAASTPELFNGASAQPIKAKAKGARQRNVFVDASKEQLLFLERIVQQLQEAGASNVHIDHSTDRWMVLVVDAK